MSEQPARLKGGPRAAGARVPNPSSVPGTCLWCGKKLRQKWWWDTDCKTCTEIPGTRVKTYPKPGDYGDGHFCGLRCGYAFGTVLADGGRRIVVKASQGGTTA